METDKELGILRNKLVPKKSELIYDFIITLFRVSENDFWKNYFYHIEVIKYKYNMQNKIKPETSVSNPTIIQMNEGSTLIEKEK